MPADGAGELGALLAGARELRRRQRDPAAGGLLDRHVALLERYARRAPAAVAEPVGPIDTIDPAGCAVGSSGRSPAAYLSGLRRLSLSADLGLAAIARECLRSGSLRWPEHAGAGATFSLPVASASPTGRDGTEIELDVPVALRERLRWRAGQHLVVHLAPGGVGITRSYSICAASAEIERGRVRIAVRRVAGGQGSTLLAERARPGRALEVQAPTGAMVWPPPSGPRAPALLVAAGSGITPLFGIAADVVAAPDGRAGLLVIERGPDDVMLGKRLRALERVAAGRLRVDGLWTRAGGGRPDAAALAERLRRLWRQIGGGSGAEALVYVCGTGPVAALVREALALAGLGEATVHAESFSAERDASDGERRPGGRLRVAVAGGARDVELAPGETLLAAMLRAGIEHPFSCLSGACHTCRVRVLDGEVGPDSACLERDADGVTVLACSAANRASAAGA